MCSVMSLENLFSTFMKDLAIIQSLQELQEYKSKYLGKQGLVNSLMANIGQLSLEEKKTFGAECNKIKAQMQEHLQNKQQEILERAIAEKLANETIDISLPADAFPIGKLHPLTIAAEELRIIMTNLGFTEGMAPEIEEQWYNFNALNMPESHPSRQMQDTFYLADLYDAEGKQMLLRTQTSNFQIRHLQSNPPPAAVFSIGRVYRSDSDATHTPQFHQIEGLYINQSVTIQDMLGYLQAILKQFFAVEELPIRMRPSYFPFTEPSFEIDIKCDRSNKQQIIFGSGNDWLEIMGCGMVHPQVLRNMGIDPESFQGFAFGFGLERMTMLKYNIPDLRDMFSSNQTWINHFGSR